MNRLNDIQITELGKQLYDNITNGSLSYNEMVKEYFIKMKNNNDVEYNNRIIRAINSNMSKDELKLAEYFGLSFCKL